jgi:hypothetical protein
MKRGWKSMRNEKLYVRGRGDPPPALGGWELPTLEGVVIINKVIEYADGSCLFVGVLSPVDGGRPYPVRGEVTRTGDVFLTPRDWRTRGW